MNGIIIPSYVLRVIIIVKLSAVHGLITTKIYTVAYMCIGCSSLSKWEWVN